MLDLIDSTVLLEYCVSGDDRGMALAFKYAGLALLAINHHRITSK